MPFTPQPTNNAPENKILDSTFNEIAENDIYLKERADLVDDRLGQSLNPSDSVTFSTVNTGQGDNELYPMDQSLISSSNININSINTDNISLKNKYFTGSLNASGIASITHGLDVDKIINVNGLVQHDDGYWITIPQISPSLDAQGALRLNSVTLDIDVQYSATLGSNPYRILITYTT